MNNVLKRMSHLLALGFLAVAGIVAASNARVSGVLASSDPAVQATDPSLPPREYTEDDFANELEASSEEVGVTIAQSNVTDNSQSLSFTFRSKKLVGFATGRKNYVVQIDDPNFTGDPDNPAADDYDVLDEDTDLPLFHGFVSFVMGSTSSNNAEVYLPETMTKAGKFVVKVDRIAKNAVTELGEEYEGKNTWSKINNIYIPKTITTVDAGAFMGFASANAGTKIYYEGTSLPSGFEAGWTDAPEEAIICSKTSYNSAYRSAGTSGSLDIPDALGRPLNFILGCKEDATMAGEEYNRPLVVQFDRVVKENGVEKSRKTIYEELPLTNTVGNSYDSCGPMSAPSYSRTLSYRLAENEEIDDSSIVFHNIMKASPSSIIDTSQTYFLRASIGYSEKQNITNLVNYKASINSLFAGFSMFSLTMDKNLSITSARYPQPHSLYLDVKTEMYEQNKLRIKEGLTKIRYSLYNLYNSSYHIIYQGNGGLKEVVIPIKTVVSNLVLENQKNNVVSILLKDSDIRNMEVEGQKPYSDYSINKVKTFELQNITIQMDLLAKSDSGSVSVLGKSQISYKFACITVINNKNINVFNWDLFLIFFLVGYLVVYSAAAFGVYKFMKEKYKNDEFRRVNDKKFLKKAIIGGLGLGEVLYAIIFIIMRTTFFTSTIVVFNPTDPLLIGFSIAGLIIVGYFIVYLVKAIKVNNERRRILRLKLNEDVADDGTN